MLKTDTIFVFELEKLNSGNLFDVRSATKNRIHCFKQRVDLHSIAARIVLATDNPIFSAYYAAGYRRFRTIR